jgi:chorismate synthase
MSGNSFGEVFKIHTFGESHGKSIGVIIDGLPAGVTINEDFIAKQLARRKPGQSAISSPRKEDDTPEIQSGVFENKSIGTPIAIIIKNNNQQSSDYDTLKNTFRPGHADITYQHKYGIRDYRGGGRASARETAARVAAGAVAQLFLNKYDIKIIAYVSAVGKIKLNKSYTDLNLNIVDNNMVRCPDEETAQSFINEIERVKNLGDTLGGVITCVIKNLPIGIGEPVFDKLPAELAKAMLSINATKGFEIGEGFKSSEFLGSEYQDQYIAQNNTKIETETNRAGGVQGGLSNGQDVFFNVAFKPVSTLMKGFNALSSQNEITFVEGKGRHDPCVVPRAVPIVEAMVAITITDLILRNNNSKI